MSEWAAELIEIDGDVPTAAQMQARMLHGYGHFTAMQVRGGRVRGLDLHLERLSRANAELFGAGLGQRAGFDEALLTGPDGLISEGSITNLGCFDGTAVVWPAAAMLPGITM